LYKIEENQTNNNNNKHNCNNNTGVWDVGRPPQRGLMVLVTRKRKTQASNKSKYETHVHINKAKTHKQNASNKEKSRQNATTINQKNRPQKHKTNNQKK